MNCFFDERVQSIFILRGNIIQHCLYLILDDGKYKIKYTAISGLLKSWNKITFSLAQKAMNEYGQLFQQLKHQFVKGKEKTSFNINQGYCSPKGKGVIWDNEN